MMETPTISISIPTYNRPLQLKATLEKLVVQQKENIQIHVYDNASTILINDVILNLGCESIRIHFNKCNLGLSGNILKCFGDCETDWLWILGDDDSPSLNAIEIIFNEIKKYPNATFINFKSNLSYSDFCNDIVCAGSREAIEKMVSFSNLLFISAGVYNISKLKESVKAGYYFASSFAPHLGVLFDYLNKYRSEEMVYSASSIVEWSAPGKSDKWNDSLVNRSLQNLCYLISDKSVRGDLFDKINLYHPVYLPNILGMIRLIVYADYNKADEIVSQYFERRNFLFFCNKISSFNYLIKSGLLKLVILSVRLMPIKYLFKLFISKPISDFSVSHNVYLSLNMDNRL